MEEVKPRKERLRSPPRPRTKGIKKSPAASEALKRLWADPEWRAATIAKSHAGMRAKPGCSSRWGVPDGMRRDVAKRFWKQARFEATLTMKKLEKAGVLDDADDMAKEALHTALSVMRMECQQKDRLAAARLVLDFTKSKPVAKSELTVSRAEEWLQAVTEQNGKVIEGYVSDAEASA